MPDPAPAAITDEMYEAAIRRAFALGVPVSSTELEEILTAALSRAPASPAPGGLELEKTASEHELKCWPSFFEAILSGRKRFELRRADDRNFQVGDTLRLREFVPESQTYTGREQVVTVTYIISVEQACALSDKALSPNYCILSIAPRARLTAPQALSPEREALYAALREIERLNQIISRFNDDRIASLSARDMGQP